MKINDRVDICPLIEFSVSNTSMKNSDNDLKK